MRKKLIVSEVARLLDISAHTIRYYDKEGLLSSDSDSKSGYRIFDMEDVARLSNIIILRESGIPIKEIRKLIGEYSTSAYRQQLDLSLQKLIEQERKIEMKKRIIIESLSLLAEDRETVDVKHHGRRFLKKVTTQSYSKEKNPVEIYEEVLDADIKDVMYRDMIYELRDDDMIISFESNNQTKDFIEAGDYLEYSFIYKYDNQVTAATMKMLEYGKKRQMILEERIYMNMQPHAMLIVDYGYRATLFTRIISKEGDIK